MRLCALGLALVVVSACGGDKNSDTGGVAPQPGTDGADACGTSAAVVTGTVAGVETVLVSAESEEEGRVEADSYGASEDPEGVTYALNLPEGDWLVSVESDGCAPEYSVLTVVACTEYQVDFLVECER